MSSKQIQARLMLECMTRASALSEPLPSAASRVNNGSGLFHFFRARRCRLSPTRRALQRYSRLAMNEKLHAGRSAAKRRAADLGLRCDVTWIAPCSSLPSPNEDRRRSDLALLSLEPCRCSSVSYECLGHAPGREQRRIDRPFELLDTSCASAALTPRQLSRSSGKSLF